MTNKFFIYFILFTLQFTFINISKGQVIINEIMANPNNGTLPPYEYIEILNNSSTPYQLSQLSLGINNNRVELPEYLLAPNQYVILCSQEAADSFERYGNVLSLSRWYALANNGATLRLMQNENIIDEVVYNNAMHTSTAKRNGGWSLERINPSWICNLNTNWSSSIAPNGGTPGRNNSIYDKNALPDLTITNYTLTNNQVELTFNLEKTHLQVFSTSHFRIDKNIGSPTQLFWDDNNGTLILTFGKNIEENEIYTLQINPIQICNLLTNTDDVTLFKQTNINKKDIIISEILFNPKDGGVDFVEIYNTTSYPINLKNWLLGNRNITSELIFIQPYSYLALTNNKALVSLHYPSAPSNNILQIPSIPAYPNQQGNVSIYTSSNHLIDSIFYRADMHDPLLSNVKGISLERQSLNPNDALFDLFFSSSTLNEGATPGYRNSIDLDKNFKKNKIFLTSKTVSPNADSHEDQLEIQYEFIAPGYFLNINIYNDKGTLINRLIRNQKAATEGKIQWNGQSENGQIVPSGHYIMVATIHSNQGKTERFKQAFVIVPNTLTY